MTAEIILEDITPKKKVSYHDLCCGQFFKCSTNNIDLFQKISNEQFICTKSGIIQNTPLSHWKDIVITKVDVKIQYVVSD